MNYGEYINSKANDYKLIVLDDTKANTEYSSLVNSVFFPVILNIQKWLEETEVRSFYEYEYSGNFFVNRFCTRDEIDNIPFLSPTSSGLSKYTIFSNLKCRSLEEARHKTPTNYYCVQKDFYSTIDKIIFNRLKHFKRLTANIYSYKVSNQIDLRLYTKREHIEFHGISGYTFPSLSINIKDEHSINFETIDVRSLLFLPARSFLFFYSDSHDYKVDNLSGAISDVTRKNDEAVIYFLEEEQKYIITNSWENIERYNKYIQIILELSLHYFSVFEKWLIGLIKNSDLKAI